MSLGKYQLVRHLATGGMAEVILARVTGIEGFERHVVIKKIRDDRAREQGFVQMFLDEARLAASLHHNNIVHVHDIGQDSGEYFFTMEYVHGEDLRRLLAHMAERERQLPLDHCITIALATAAALHHAHEHRGPDRSFAGIVHRDVSPANILVAYDGTVKVVDFGIAKLAHRTDETGLMKGKVAYMSPEQCLGHDVDRRSDIFCLGIVLYELVTVRRLFKGANDFLTMSSILHGVIPPPSELRPDLPPELEAIILKALALQPEDRYQTADEMRAALERFAANTRLQTSTTALADFLRTELGVRDVPWMIDEEEPELSIDFDGSGTGVVAAPDAAVLAMPAVRASSVVKLEGPLPAPPRRKRLLLAASGAVTAVLAIVAIVIATSSSDGTAAASRVSTPEIAPEPAPAPAPAPAPPAPPDLAASAAEPPPEDPAPAAEAPAPGVADGVTVEKKRASKRPAKKPPKGVWDPRSLLPPK
ncbi:MAG TPA: serine/threonine-protein kinase [Kofleriaceae bacterium]|nr:serine/threonine-protein kinase [Kofleriaceae bacterium]